MVFITAYPERFLTGERPEPAFLISKPFQPAMVSAVASQALFFQRNSRNRHRRRRRPDLICLGCIQPESGALSNERAGFFLPRADDGCVELLRAVASC